jgi:hypothetical protein
MMVCILQIINKIKFEVDKNISKPYIKYRWSSNTSEKDAQYYMNNNVVYAVIVTDDDNFSKLIHYENTDTTIVDICDCQIVTDTTQKTDIYSEYY